MLTVILSYLTTVSSAFKCHFDWKTQSQEHIVSHSPGFIVCTITPKKVYQFYSQTIYKVITETIGSTLFGDKKCYILPNLQYFEVKHFSKCITLSKAAALFVVSFIAINLSESLPKQIQIL